jgi:hypothetical protein
MQHSDLEVSLFNRLHPPSSIPPRKYSASALGYSACEEKSRGRDANHFSRVPTQKVSVISSHKILNLTDESHFLDRQKHELRARVARLEEATRTYIAQRAQSALERSMVPGLQEASHTENRTRSPKATRSASEESGHGSQEG